jgi:hypothetical protein
VAGSSRIGIDADGWRQLLQVTGKTIPEARAEVQRAIADICADKNLTDGVEALRSSLVSLRQLEESLIPATGGCVQLEALMLPLGGVRVYVWREGASQAITLTNAEWNALLVELQAFKGPNA